MQYLEFFSLVVSFCGLFFTAKYVIATYWIKICHWNILNQNFSKSVSHGLMILLPCSHSNYIGKNFLFSFEILLPNPQFFIGHFLYFISSSNQICSNWVSMHVSEGFHVKMTKVLDLRFRSNQVRFMKWSLWIQVDYRHFLRTRKNCGAPLSKS